MRNVVNILLLILVIAQFFNQVESQGFGDIIKRGYDYPRIAKRSVQDYQKCQQKNTGKKKEVEALLIVGGSRLFLTCNLCLSPKTSAVGVWRRLIPNTASVVPIELNGRRSRILSDLSLEITHTWKKDAGIYYCQHENKIYAQYAVDVVEKESHRYVILSGKRKNKLTKDTVLADLNLVVKMQWSEWSPCSRCGKVGKRRKAGICFVKKLDAKKFTRPVSASTLDEYKNGIPCRSSYLPEGIRNVPIVKQMKSEFVIAFCKIPCPTSAGIVVITDKTGKVIDTVDNSKGYYSMHQPLPKLPPLARRKTVYEEIGSGIILSCPGNSKDKFLIWRNDSYVINPSRVHIKTNGRIKIDIVNNLHIRKLRYSDSAVYSCWDDKQLIGTIRLQVTEKIVSRTYRIYMLNIGFLFTILTVVMITFTLCKNVKLETKR